MWKELKNEPDIFFNKLDSITVGIQLLEEFIIKMVKSYPFADCLVMILILEHLECHFVYIPVWLERQIFYYFDDYFYYLTTFLNKLVMYQVFPSTSKFGCMVIFGLLVFHLFGCMVWYLVIWFSIYANPAKLLL